MEQGIRCKKRDSAYIISKSTRSRKGEWKQAEMKRRKKVETEKKR